MTWVPLSFSPISRTEEPLSRLDLTVVLLTFNEGRHIERAIASVVEIARDIIVVDSFSTDDTCDRARVAGARVLQNRFVNQAQQFQWGLDHGGIETGWVMRLDADEVVEADLRQEIMRRLPRLSTDVVGVNIDRKHIFMGRWIRHGGRYPLRLLRIWRTGQGRVEDRWMDEHIVVWGGRTVNFVGGFADVNLNDLGFFTSKHNAYATREALEQLGMRYGLFARDQVDAMPVSGRAGTKRRIKEKIYNHLPFWVGPLVYFMFRYFAQLGFLDGRPGLIYHFLQGFWYRFLVGARVIELENSIADCPTNAARIARLIEVTGLKISPGA